MRLVYLLIIIGIVFGSIDIVGAKTTSVRKVAKVHKAPRKVARKAPAKKPQVTRKKALRMRTPARVVSEPRAVSSGELAPELNYIINSAANESRADVGVYVKSMRNGDMLYSRNIHQPLTPASTLKVLTAEAALIFLKPDYRFQTQLLTDAKTIKDGVLQGNLYIVLGGDPSLTYNDLVDLLLNLRNEEMEKYRRIYDLRDNACSSTPRQTFWDQF